MTTHLIPAGTAPETRAARISRIVAELYALDPEQAHRVVVSDETRGQAANRYWWAVVIDTIRRHCADTMGEQYSAEAVHEYLKRMFIEPTVETIAGDEVRVYATTTTMGKRAFGELIERVTAWAATDLDCVVPPPDPSLVSRRERAARAA